MPFGDPAERCPAVALPAAAARPPRAETCLLLLAAVAVLWLATRPYGGVLHDSRLYTAQALSALDPARFAHDVFLHFGSQDRFTVFSRLYAPVLAWAGVSAGALLLTLVAHAAWLGGAYCLARGLLGDPVRALAAVAGLVALPGGYGSNVSFQYGEPFLTPRLFAEALTMAALGCAARGRTLPAAAVLAGGALCHPIMAVPGALALFFHKGAGRRAWWAAAACLGAAAGVLAASGVEPFARLGVRLDAAWVEVARWRVPDVFLGGWSLLDHCVLAGQAALAALALATLGAGPRRLVLAVLAAAFAGLAATAVGADLLKNQLLTNIQSWRATWLLGVVAHLVAVPLVWEFARRGGPTGRAAAAALHGGLGLLLLARVLPGAYLWAALLLALAVVLALRCGEPRPLDTARRAMAAVAAAAIGLSVAHMALGTKDAMAAWPEEFRSQLWTFTLCVAGAALVAAAVFRAEAAPARAAPASALAAAAALLLCSAALGWDQRSAWARFVESPEPVPAGLAALVPDDAVVYWDAGVELLWLRLKKGSYHSCTQGAGVIFFRETAMAYRHRAESLRFETRKTDRCWGEGGDERRFLTEAELRRACAREPELDLIVLPHTVEGVARREWRSPVKLRFPRLVSGVLDVPEFDRFFAYDCDALR